MKHQWLVSPLSGLSRWCIGNDELWYVTTYNSWDDPLSNEISEIKDGISLDITRMSTNIRSLGVINEHSCGYGSIPIDTFLVEWTSICQLFWGSLGTRVLTHPHVDTASTVGGYGRTIMENSPHGWPSRLANSHPIGASCEHGEVIYWFRKNKLNGYESKPWYPDGTLSWFIDVYSPKTW